MFIQGKLLSYGDDLSETFTIRRKVFVEEQGIPEEIVFDDLDTEAMHVLVFEEAVNKKAVASGRIIYEGQHCQIDNIAVLEEFRNKKYGDFTVRMLLSKAFTAGINEVSVVSQNSTVDFFKKFGFEYSNKDNGESENSKCKMVIYSNNIITLCNKKG